MSLRLAQKFIFLWDPSLRGKKKKPTWGKVPLEHQNIRGENQIHQNKINRKFLFREKVRKKGKDLELERD